MSLQQIEKERLMAHYSGANRWLAWGPYLSERQWGTVREDYSPYGTAWDYFPHDHARSRVYRWGEDGIAGICDEHCNLCFSVAMWNKKDPIIKERLFGLTGQEGNHGEDVKELYYYLDSSPSHSYMQHLYKYPQRAFPYDELVSVNRNRSKADPEFELLDTGVFDADEYFDVYTTYAKNSPTELLIEIKIINRNKETASLCLLPTLWFRNRWSFDPHYPKPVIERMATTRTGYSSVAARHHQLGNYFLVYQDPSYAFMTENESNTERLFKTPNGTPYVKDAFHTGLISGHFDGLSENNQGTKFAPVYDLEIEPHGERTIKLLLTTELPSEEPFSRDFDEIIWQRKAETDAFYNSLKPDNINVDLQNIQRQAYAGMLWTKQYYHIDMELWLDGDPGQTPPPASRKNGRNKHWRTLNNEDIISMPDKWEYPWYAAWDLAFHCIPLAQLDQDYAKEQLILMLREWYMHPNGQIPAYEWAFGDVNPPVHAWATKKVYDIDKAINGQGDIYFLKRVFQKLLLNFTWWVNRKDENGNNVFEGGFLGLDNIGIFDRSRGVPGGGILEQVDGTSWMAMYALNMLDIAIEIALVDPSFEDVTTKFLEHFIYITEALNQLSDDFPGAWDEHTDFFYDMIQLPGQEHVPIRVRSLVGITPLFAVLVLEAERIAPLKDFCLRLKWFMRYRRKLNKYKVLEELESGDDILLSMVPANRLTHILETILDEDEFLAPGGIRSLSKIHEDPYVKDINGQPFSLKYEPAESSTYLFGGNSNWRGPVWVPMNYLIIESLLTFDRHYHDGIRVCCPHDSERWVNLAGVAEDIAIRLISIFEKNSQGHRPVNGKYDIYAESEAFKDLVLFYEYFDGNNSRGVGAAHQTGWTGLVADLIYRFKK